jgi:DNA-binding helix-hairpin-helix protein with protein kinase domain
MVSPKPLASGGEGEVYTLLVGPNNQCAKIYFLNQRTKEREEKINFIVSNIPIQQNSGRFLLCMPTETLFDAKGKFVGFLMPIAFDNSVQLYELVTTQINKKLTHEWHQKYDRRIKIGIENRLKLFVNIAIAINTIHKTKNIVLVDLKPQNILITSDAKVSIIDLDSIQIAHEKNVVYPAKVATPEYTPKEGEKLNPATDFIPETWDRFSLAVVFYEILFGIHPYTSTSGGQGNRIKKV